MSSISRYYTNIRPEVYDLLSGINASRILEVGCGAGLFRENFKYKNIYHGVEMDEAAASLAKKRLDDVFIGSILDVSGQLQAASYDLIVCNDVLEHIYDSEAFISIIKSLLKYDGRILFSVPNVRYVSNLREILISKDWRYVDEGVLDRTHVRFFTKKSLLRLFAENGLVVKKIKGINGKSIFPKSFNKLVRLFSALILGFDILFLQFAVLVELE